MDKRYEIYMPAGDVDFIGKNIPLAVTSSYEQMLHYLYIYHTDRKVFGTLLKKVEGPIYVRIREE